MPRRLLTTRIVALTLLAVVLALACVRLGFWQLDRARLSEAVPVATDEKPVPLRSLGAAADELPASAAGQLVLAAGTYDAAHQYLVVDRQESGKDASWVLTVLHLTDGSGLLVVRGWVPVGTAAPVPPAGPVTVTGRLTAAEPAGGIQPVGQQLPPGSIAAVSPIDLLSKVPYTLYDAYVVLTDQVPAPSTDLALVPSPQPKVSSVPGFYLQHLAYVGLWWAIGLFVIFFWWRVVRDELADTDDELAESEEAEARG